MKRIVIVISLIFMSSLVLVAQEERKVKANAEMAFESLSHDYGSIVFGANGAYDFTFKNNSQKPIVITNVKSSCGCTVPSWPKEPVQPGKEGKITVKYNTKLAGSFNKTVQVFSTADNSPVKLSIRGRVNAKPADLKGSDKYGPSKNAETVKAVETTTQKVETQRISGETQKIKEGDLTKQEAYLKRLEARKETIKKKK